MKEDFCATWERDLHTFVVGKATPIRVVEFDPAQCLSTRRMPVPLHVVDETYSTRSNGIFLPFNDLAINPKFIEDWFAEYFAKSPIHNFLSNPKRRHNAWPTSATPQLRRGLPKHQLLIFHRALSISPRSLQL
jgi:hypothetical protein